jgi:hypothetical protein
MRRLRAQLQMRTDDPQQMIAADEPQDLAIAHYWHLAYVSFVHEREHIAHLRVRWDPTELCYRDHRLADGSVSPGRPRDTFHLMDSDQAEQLTIGGDEKTPPPGREDVVLNELR